MSSDKMAKLPRTKRVLFGTDGVRDVANKGDMTPEMAMRLGQAFVLFLESKGISKPRIVVGRDTRRSGIMLEGALAAGMMSAGAEVLSSGVIPTPGVSYAVKKLSADGGAVISASHNPAEYNGIKYLGSDGCKLSDEAELNVERYYFDDDFTGEQRPTGASIGMIQSMPEIVSDYASHLLTLLNNKEDMIPELIFDCAHGAASAVLPILMDQAGAACKQIGATPDGMNINSGVGVMSIQNLGNHVVKNSAPLGFAFDGDADRCLAVDAEGRMIDGDILLWVLARWLKQKNLLGSGVVVTVMSNMALEDHLGREGIQVFRCPVGDRYVLETMREKGARLGGEQSGHIIADAFTSTGDGLCTSLLFLNALRELGLNDELCKNVKALNDNFGRYAQKLSNIKLKSREILEANMARVNEIANEAHEKMQGSGRVFVRPSGTEPLLRILVEARERELVEQMSAVLLERLGELCR